ncbi:hypothetical protein D3C80_1490220 [compost metagenome]
MIWSNRFQKSPKPRVPIPFLKKDIHGLYMPPGFTLSLSPPAPMISATLGLTGSSLRSPIRITLALGFSATFLSMIALHTLAAFCLFQADAASPPLREGQWFTNTVTVSPPRMPVTCRISRVYCCLLFSLISTNNASASSTLNKRGL